MTKWLKYLKNEVCYHSLLPFSHFSFSTLNSFLYFVCFPFFCSPSLGRIGLFLDLKKNAVRSQAIFFWCVSQKQSTDFNYKHTSEKFLLNFDRVGSIWKTRNTCFYLTFQCSPSLLLLTWSFVGIPASSVIAFQYDFIFVRLRQTEILRYINLRLKRRQYLSKITFELIRAQARRVNNNKSNLCKVRVAPVIAGN